VFPDIGEKYGPRAAREKERGREREREREKEQRIEECKGRFPWPLPCRDRHRADIRCIDGAFVRKMQHGVARIHSAPSSSDTMARDGHLGDAERIKTFLAGLREVC